MTRLVLHYAPDNASLIIRLALEELGVDYDTVLVDRMADAQRSAGYLALNPHGLIPTLETPHGPVFETAAILLWLADTYGALAPAPGTRDRAGFLKWLFFASNTVHSGCRMLFYPKKYVGSDPTHQTALRKTVQAAMKTHLTQLDNLAASDARFFAGAALSVLDFYIPVMLRWMALYPKQDCDWRDLSDTPHLLQLAQRIEERPGMSRAIEAEGLGPTPLSAPTYPNPPEGSAL